MISRRTFLKLSGTGLLLGLCGHTGRVLAQEALSEEGFHPFAFLWIGENGKIIFYLNKAEMGQGVYTALPMIIADELGADLESLTIRFAPARAAFNDPVSGAMATGGSSSIRHMYLPLRQMGAATRETLIAAAAKKWDVAAQTLRVEHGQVLGPQKTASFAELAPLAKNLPVAQNAKLKDPSQFRYISKPIPRLDIPEKTHGKAQFGIDVQVPGMLYAAVARAPAFGAKVKSYDDKKATAIPKVKGTYPIASGIAVVADTLDAAWRGCDALLVEWEGGDESLNDESLTQRLTAALANKGRVARDDGQVDAQLRQGQKVEATYLLPYLAHVAMEPMNATARVSKDRCEVWVGTQAETNALKAAKAVTGLPEESIHIYNHYLGGGFGRRSSVDYVRDAVEIAKASGNTIKLIYRRDEDTATGFFRPANASHIAASLDENGMPLVWSHKIVVPSIFAFARPQGMKNGIEPAAVEGLENIPYDIPKVRVEWVRYDLPVPVWFWRSVGSTHNAFTVECFMDELASRAKKDPVEYRLALLKNNADARRVITAAAEAANWGKPLDNGLACGFAYHFSFGSHAAEVVFADVDEKSGAITVKKIVCAIDCGPHINPDIIKAQVEGGALMGLSSALHEKVRLQKGGVASRNFDHYPILRMNETPTIEVVLVQGMKNLGGVGEPGTPPAAPALANAVFAATGRRIRTLPLSKEVVLAHLQARQSEESEFVWHFA